MKLPTKADIKKFFDSDRAILIACIFIALVFWLLVKMSQTFPTAANYDVNYKLPAGKSFVTSPPQVVNATLRGKGWDLVSSKFRKRKTEISFELNDLASQGIDRNTVIDKIKQSLTPGILVEDINTDYIFIQMESESEKQVPIRLISDIDLDPQFQLSDTIQLIPDSVIITGPATEVEQINVWETKPLNLKELKKNQEVQLELKRPKNQELHLSEDKIMIKIPIEQFTEKSMFVPITILNAPDSLKTFPETARLNCIVGISKFNEINKSSFQLVVDLKGIPLNTEKNTVPVKLSRQPDFVRAINYQPKSVEFFFVETAKDSILVDSLK